MALVIAGADAAAAMVSVREAEPVPPLLVALSVTVEVPAEPGVPEIDPVAVERAVAISALGGFYVTQQAARRMVPHGRGAILLTGASASIKGFPLSSAFAMGKFALRGMAQSAARELGPKGIHVAHFVIDGGVRSSRRHDPADKPDSRLDPDAIAKVYIDVMRQHRSAWSLEVELRPWVERF